jgi:hypothetical protein
MLCFFFAIDQQTEAQNPFRINPKSLGGLHEANHF